MPHNSFSLKAAVRKSGGPEVRWSQKDAAHKLSTQPVIDDMPARNSDFWTSGLPDPWTAFYRFSLVAVALFACLISAGCAHRPPASLTWHTTPAAAKPGRVAVVPVWLGSGVGPAAMIATDSLAASLRECGLHEVVTLSPEQRTRLMPDDILFTNSLNTNTLLRVRDVMKADSILIARIEQFDAYDPIVVGMTVHLVSCHDGAKLWEAAGHFDGRLAEIQEDVRYWYGLANGDSNANLAGWRGTLVSPQAFTRYVTDRLVWTLVPPK